MHKTLAIAIGLSAFVMMPVAARAQGAAASDPDVKEVLEYRLTVPTLAKVTQAAKNMAVAAKNDPRFAKQAALKSEIKKLEDKDERTEAEDTRLEQLRTELEQAEQKDNAAGDTKTLSDMAAALDKEPLVRKALADAGMSSREFAKFSLAYLQAGMIAGMMKQGVIKEVPKELAATVNMENVKFVQEHEAELEALGKAMKAVEDK